MTWFKVDDAFWGHPKRVATPPAAVGLWVTAGSWCAQQLTDGFVPRHVVPMLGGTPKLAQELVSSGLWEEVQGGWRFHDWEDTQPSRTQVRDRQRKNAERIANWRARNGRTGASHLSAVSDP